MMNKYIETDIEQAITLLKVAINNALFDLESGTVKEYISFGYPIPLQLIIQCAQDRGWVEDMDDWDWTNGWEVDYWYKMVHPDKRIYMTIGGSLLCGNSYIGLRNEKD